MKLSNTIRKTILGIAMILIAATALASFAPSVSAEGNGPLTPIPGLGRIPNETLVRMHKVEGSWVTEQGKMFNTANNLSNAFLALITAEKKKGKDVTILQTAYDAYDTELVVIRDVYNNAGVIVFNLVGWRSTGDVRDRLAAGESILSGRVALRDVNQRMRTLMDSFERAFVKWRASRISGDKPDPYNINTPPPTH